MPLVTLANEKSFEASCDVSLLESARINGIVLEHSCRTGRCGTCKALVLRGSTRVIGDSSGLHAAERDKGYVLTCTTAPVDDVRLDIDDVSLLADFPSRTTPCRIDSITRVTSDVVEVVLRFPPKASPNYLPGQYVDVIGGSGLRRSYSLANKQKPDGKVEMHIRMVPSGAMSDYWFGSAKIGDLLRLDGPKGTFFLRDVSDLNVVFFATGTGIAPIKAMLEGLATRVDGAMPKSITVFWGARCEPELYWEPKIVGLGTLEFVPVLSRGGVDWNGARGYIQRVFLERLPDLSQTVVYACGSQAMIDTAFVELVAAGLSPKRFYSDAFVSSSG